MIPYNIISELVISGCKFKYESYKHKEALEDYQKSQNQQNSSNYLNELFRNSSWSVPDEYKLKHLTWRIGKIREIHFNKECKMWRFKVGNKYYKTFYISDFGVRFKPILFKSDDKYDLISQGFAIEDSL